MVDAMFDSPMREFASIIINHPSNDMAAMTFSVRAGTYEEAEEVWEQVWSAVAQANAQAPGQMQGAMGMSPGGYQQSAGGYPKPKVRNPVMTLVIPFAIMFVTPVIFGILASILEIGALALIGNIGLLAGWILWLMNVIKMTNEMKAVTRNDAFAWWPVLIPIYQLLWAFSMVPAEMAKAKQIAGVQTPPRGPILYLLFLPFALAADLNDIAKAP